MKRWMTLALFWALATGVYAETYDHVANPLRLTEEEFRLLERPDLLPLQDGERLPPAIHRAPGGLAYADGRPVDEAELRAHLRHPTSALLQGLWQRSQEGSLSEEDGAELARLRRDRAPLLSPRLDQGLLEALAELEAGRGRRRRKGAAPLTATYLGTGGAGSGSEARLAAADLPEGDARDAVADQRSVQASFYGGVALPYYGAAQRPPRVVETREPVLAAERPRWSGEDSISVGALTVALGTDAIVVSGLGGGRTFTIPLPAGSAMRRGLNGSAEYAVGGRASASVYVGGDGNYLLVLLRDPRSSTGQALYRDGRYQMFKIDAALGVTDLAGRAVAQPSGSAPVPARLTPAPSATVSSGGRRDGPEIGADGAISLYWLDRLEVVITPRSDRITIARTGRREAEELPLPAGSRASVEGGAVVVRSGGRVVAMLRVAAAQRAVFIELFGPDGRTLLKNGVAQEFAVDGWGRLELAWRPGEGDRPPAANALLGDPRGCADLCHQQEGGTCGLCAAQQMLIQNGLLPRPPPGSDRQAFLARQETVLFELALANRWWLGGSTRHQGSIIGLTQPQPLRFGGTGGRGLNVNEYYVNAEQFKTLVARGRMLLVSVEASILWNRPDSAGGHAIVVTGARTGPGGEILGYYVNDTGTNEAAKYYTRDHFHRAMFHGREFTYVYEAFAPPSGERGGLLQRINGRYALTGSQRSPVPGGPVPELAPTSPAPAPSAPVPAPSATQIRLADARAQLGRGELQAAVDTLEAGISRIDGNRAYLDLLAQAYRARIRQLRAAGQPAAALVLARRLAIIAPGDPLVEEAPAPVEEPIPAAITVSAARTAYAEAARHLRARRFLPAIEAINPHLRGSSSAQWSALEALLKQAYRGYVEEREAARDFETADRYLRLWRIYEPAVALRPREREAIAAAVAAADAHLAARRPRQAFEALQPLFRSDLYRLSDPLKAALVRTFQAYAPWLAAQGRDREARLYRDWIPLLDARAAVPSLGGTAPSVAPSTPAPRAEPGLVRVVDGGGAGAERGAPFGSRWRSVETDNFRVFFLGEANRALAERVARTAERTRAHVRELWGVQESPTGRTDVYLHADQADYASRTGVALGSPGHTTLRIDAGRIVSRTIDLRMDHSGWEDTVLPHEVTHSALGSTMHTEAGGHAYLPRWADEGMAVLSEPPSRVRVLLNAARTVAGDPARMQTARTLMTTAEYPRDGRAMLDFYALSVSLTKFLTELRGPRTFAAFLRSSRARGWPAALREHYGRDGIDGFESLERLWSAYAAGGSRAAGGRDFSAAPGL